MRKVIWENDLEWEMVPAYGPLPPIMIKNEIGEYEQFQLTQDDGIDDMVETGMKSDDEDD